mmetsp:Transcript_26752/g.83802  ORF Transcript_26752/g.83802 Transcript_26752/m.83802 type:complete len:85 (+) Transcript_26752:198-452(+)
MRPLAALALLATTAGAPKAPPAWARGGDGWQAWIDAAGAEGLPLRAGEAQTWDAPVNHSDPSAGTFQQRWYENTEYYKPGGPVL